MKHNDTKRHTNKTIASALCFWMAVFAVFFQTAAFAQTPEPADTTQEKAEDAAPAPVDPLADGKLIFCGDASNEPYSFTDSSGAAMGYDVDVAKEIGNVLGVEVEILLMQKDKAIEAVQSGQAEVLLGIGESRASESIANKWALCGPTTVRKYRIAILKDQYGLEADEQSEVATVLKGTRVAINASDPVNAYFEGSRVVTVINTIDAIRTGRMLTSRQVLAIAADENTLRYIDAKTHEAKDIRMAGTYFYEVNNYGPAVAMADQSGLANKITNAVGKLRTNGKLAELQTRWSFDYPINPVSYAIFILIGAGGTLALLIVMGLVSLVKKWQRTLSTAVESRTRKLNAEVEVLRKQVTDLQNRDPSYNSFSGEEPALELLPEGENEDSTRPLVLDQLIKDSTDELQDIVGENIKLALQIRDEMPAVMADEEAITSVLKNLCGNARDAINIQKKIAPETPERIWIAMRVADDSEKPANMKKNTDPFVALSVRDAGCGISPDMVQKIFQKGFTTKENASGEGLSFVYATVAKHGGWIDVESATGRGATISVFLPAVNM